METKPYHQRDLRICYFNTESRILDKNKMILESRLKKLGNVDIIDVSSLEDTSLRPCDLLLVEASQIPEEEFYKWLSGFGKRLVSQGDIWIPALIISDTPFEILNSMMPEAIDLNWYFDILDPDHIDSLPIRVTNLLRIHDHLHEVGRYKKTLDGLNASVESLSSELDSIKAAKT